MSLLLDALRRAEQEKLARRATSAHGDDGAARDKGMAGAVEPGPRRKLELEGAEDRAATPAAVEEVAAIAEKRGREGAKAVFAAKQAEMAVLPTAPGRNRTVLAIVIGGAAIAAVAGAYFWYEVSRIPGPVARAPLPAVAPRPVTPAPNIASEPVASPSDSRSALPSAAPDAAAALPGETPSQGKTGVPPVALLRPEQAPATPVKPKPQPKAAEELVMNLLKASSGARPAAPLKLTRTIEPPRVSPEVNQGYEALKRGDVAAARKHYEEALAADSTSLDAHLGLAAAAARAGDRETAVRHYRRTLVLDPRNPSAVAGLAAVADFNRPEALEAQLRADLTRHPQSQALHFTLGNLFASQSRWNEAQAAYFDAYRLDPESADLAFNLAVSLDHLGQSRLAADFYRRALAAARQQGAQFDRTQVSRRIAELKP